MIPKPGSKWLHTNGDVYTVLYVTNTSVEESRRDEYPMMVIYRGPERKLYSKSIEGFLKSRTAVPTLHDDMVEALTAMRDEFRALDLPYGSKAYQLCTSALNRVYKECGHEH